MRLPKTTLVLAGALAGLVASASIALGAPAAGPIQIIVQPGKSQGNGQILITGAVGDYGPTHAVTTAGKKISTATLKKGTIKFDLTTLTAKTNNANPAINAATCSGSLTVTAAAPVLGGTGLYAGIHGSVDVTETFGFIGPLYKSGAKKGQCNMNSNATPVAQMGVVFGTGTVSF